MVNFDECEALGLDPKKVESIARRIGKAAEEAREMGLLVFGGSTGGSLRQSSTEPREGSIVAATIFGGNWDGGDGAESDDHPDKLMRGES